MVMGKVSDKFSKVFEARESTPAQGAQSHISAGTTVKGEILTNDDVRVDGRVEGKIFSKGKVTVGEGAVMQGDIKCSNVDFFGSVDGDLYVKDVLCLKNTSSVNGNIHTRKLQVDLGARLNGSCHMLKDTPAPVPQPAEDAAPAPADQPRPASGFQPE